jgi:putative PIN family toxin of toxin-antitoxin system
MAKGAQAPFFFDMHTSSDPSTVTAPSRIALDTNTVLALWLFLDPALKPLQAQIAAGHITLLTRADAVAELEHVLAYPRFALSPDRRAEISAEYCARVLMVDRDHDAAPLPPCRDRDDQKFLEIARDGRATALLTRDKALLRLARHRQLRDRFAILTPEAWQGRSEERKSP